jgi:hypothetical protein
MLSNKTQKYSTTLVIGYFIVFTIPFLVYYNYILNHFYALGAYLYDSGWIAKLLYRNFELQNPLVFDNSSYLATHFVPFFYLTSAISYIVNINFIYFFAIFTGIMFSLQAVAVFYIFSKNSEKQYLIPAIIVSILFAMNGINISAAGYPHYEVMIATMIILFLIFYIEQKLALSIVFFILALSLREDAGFHIVAILSIYAIFNFLKEKTFDKKVISFVMIAFCYSAIVIIIQKYYFPGDSALKRIYLGEPLYSHVNFEFLYERIKYFLTNRQYMWYPLVFTLLWTVKTKNMYLLIGYIAYLPWFIFNLLAVSDAAGSMQSYYAYPFIVAIFFPIIATLKFTTNQNQNFILVSIFLLLSIVGLPKALGFNFINNLYIKYDANAASNINNFKNFLINDKSSFGSLEIDHSVAALYPNIFTSKEVIFGDINQAKNTSIHYLGSYKYRFYINQLLKSDRKYIYKVMGTPLIVASKKEINTIPLLKRTTLYKELLMRSNKTIKVNGGFHILKDNPKGLSLYGPYLPLEKAKYQLRYKIMINEVINQEKPLFAIDIISIKNALIVKEKKYFALSNLRNDNGIYTAELFFELNKPVEDIEFRLWSLNNCTFYVQDLEIKVL